MSLTNEPGICAGLIASKVQVLGNGPTREDPERSVGSDSDIACLLRPLRMHVAGRSMAHCAALDSELRDPARDNAATK